MFFGIIKIVKTYSKKQFAIIIFVVVAVIAGGFWYWQYSSSPAVDKQGAGGLGAQIFESAQNPIQGRVPEINPFAADTNPFDTETNPFKAEYKNPFE